MTTVSLERLPLVDLVRLAAPAHTATDALPLPADDLLTAARPKSLVYGGVS